MNRQQLEKLRSDKFYELPEMEVVKMIQNANDDIEKALIIEEIFSSTCVNAKEWLFRL